jgi:hypothetical protein
MNVSPDFIVAGSASLITFCFFRCIFQARLRMSTPNLLAGLVAGLGFFGLLHGGHAFLLALPVACAAFGLAIPLVLFLASLLWVMKPPADNNYRADLLDRQIDPDWQLASRFQMPRPGPRSDWGAPPSIPREHTQNTGDFSQTFKPPEPFPEHDKPPRD